MSTPGPVGDNYAGITEESLQEIHRKILSERTVTYAKKHQRERDMYKGYLVLH